MTWTGLSIHHTDSPRDTTTVEQVRGWHLALGWLDIGYHYFIDGKGKVHLGRPLSMVGAHTLGYNATHIGIAMAGNFERETPSPAQLAALERLSIDLCKKYGIPYHQVKGHRDFSATACPGRNLYSWLVWLRNRIFNVNHR